MKSLFVIVFSLLANAAFAELENGKYIGVQYSFGTYTESTIPDINQNMFTINPLRMIFLSKVEF